MGIEGASNSGCFRHYAPTADKIMEFLDSYLLFNLSLKSNLCHLVRLSRTSVMRAKCKSVGSLGQSPQKLTTFWSRNAFCEQFVKMYVQTFFTAGLLRYMWWAIAPIFHTEIRRCQQGDLGGADSFFSGVWDEAPAANEFWRLLE